MIKAFILIEPYTLDTHLKLLVGDSSDFNQAGRTLAFYPRGVQAVHGRYIILKPHMFVTTSINKIFKAPEVENPRLILYTHERDTYLQLTLNSILHSITSSDTDKPPITIVLNEPKNNVRSTALNFVKKYSGQVDVLEVAPNAKMSAVCIALIWHRPKYFVVIEDDFILPNYVPKKYEHWPKQFVEKLNYFDLCGWGTNFDNYPY